MKISKFIKRCLRILTLMNPSYKVKVSHLNVTWMYMSYIIPNDENCTLLLDMVRLVYRQPRPTKSKIHNMPRVPAYESIPPLSFSLALYTKCANLNPNSIIPTSFNMSLNTTYVNYTMQWNIMFLHQRCHRQRESRYLHSSQCWYSGPDLGYSLYVLPQLQGHTYDQDCMHHLTAKFTETYMYT